MRNLYDVFSAIRADEGDHVNTMQSCLDEKVALLSPSIEKRVLFGAGIAAAASAILSGGDISETTNLLSLNTDDLAIDSLSGIEFDAILAGAVALISQIFGGNSDAIVEASEVAVSMEAMKDGGVLAQILGEGFAAGFLASKLLSSKKEKSQEEQANEDETKQDATTNDETLS
jgi:hypothetical protein